VCPPPADARTNRICHAFEYVTSTDSRGSSRTKTVSQLGRPAMGRKKRSSSLPNDKPPAPTVNKWPRVWVPARCEYPPWQIEVVVSGPLSYALRPPCRLPPCVKRGVKPLEPVHIGLAWVTFRKGRCAPCTATLGVCAKSAPCRIARTRPQSKSDRSEFAKRGAHRRRISWPRSQPARATCRVAHPVVVGLSHPREVCVLEGEDPHDYRISPAICPPPR
jgi:hypothetical protein